MPNPNAPGLKPGDKVERGRRFRALIERAAGAPPLDAEARTLELTFSSEEPVPRWFGDEVLSHASGAADLSRLNDGAPLLFNHAMGDLLGVVERAWIGTDRRGHALVRFAKTARGDEMMGLVQDGILRNVSFAYDVDNYEASLDAAGRAADGVYTATRWLAYEISLVTVPADASVGVGRADDSTARPVALSARNAAEPNPAAPAAITEEGNTMKRHFRNAAGADGAAAGFPAPAAAPANQSPDDIRKAERERIAGIEELGRRFKLNAELVRGLVERGASIEAARGAAAEAVLAGASQPVADFGRGGNPDLTDKEKGRYSLMRAVNAAINKDWSKAGFELECSRAIGQNSGRGDTTGFFMPTNVPFARRLSPREVQQRAAYSTGAAATGGVLVQTDLLAGNFIELLRNQARVMQLGATMLSGLVGNVDLPRQAGAGTAYWVGNGAAPPEAEATFEKLGLTPRTLGAYSIVTRNMLLQATPDVEMLARADMLAIIALAIDAATLYGSGAAGQPMGISNTPGIGSVVGGTNGAQITIDHLIDLETQVTAANAPENSLAYLGNAKTVGALKKLKSTTGQYLWTGSAVGAQSGTPGEINGYPVARSNQARSTLTKGSSSGVCSEIYFGAWSELIIGEWGVLEILPNPYGAAYSAGGIELRALQTLDVGTRHPQSFAVMTDALTA